MAIGMAGLYRKEDTKNACSEVEICRYIISACVGVWSSVFVNTWDVVLRSTVVEVDLLTMH